VLQIIYITVFRVKQLNNLKLRVRLLNRGINITYSMYRVGCYKGNMKDNSVVICQRNALQI